MGMKRVVKMLYGEVYSLRTAKTNTRMFGSNPLLTEFQTLVLDISYEVM